MIIEDIAASQMYDNLKLFYKETFVDDPIIHYTSTEVLDIILSNATFRASHILYLNDANEYYKGLKYIKEHTNNYSSDNESTNIFCISFSKKNDLLSQWITYAKESGVAIELDHELLMLKQCENKTRFVFGIESKETLENDMGNMEYHDVVNNEDNYSNLVFDTNKVLHNITYLGDNLKENIQTAHEFLEENVFGISLYAAYLKDTSFTAEDETRAAFIYHKKPYKNTSLSPKINYYRTEKGILRPYINVRIMFCDDTGRNKTDRYTPMLPLKSITIGPSGNQQEVFNSVVHRITFGNNKLYNYSLDKELLNKRLNDYWEKIKNWLLQNKIVNKDEKDLLNTLETKIKGENGGELKSSQEKNTEEYIALDKVDHIIDKIKNNFHFSKEGVIISKSSIPYIF